MSNRTTKRILAALVIVLAFSTFVLAEQPQLRLGEIKDYAKEVIAPGVEHHWVLAMSKTGPQQIFYLVVDSNQDYLQWGASLASDQVIGMEKTTEQVKRYAETGKTVIAAFNADFYDVTNGEPLGIVIKQGELITGFRSRGSFGVTKNGQGVIGLPEHTVSLKLGDAVQEISQVKINKSRKDGDFAIYTYDYSTATAANGEGIEVVVKLEQSETNKFRGKIIDVKQGGGTPLAEDILVLSASPEQATLLTEAEVGASVELTLSLAEPWNEIAEAVSGNHILLKDGINQYPGGAAGGEAPRTAVGIKADGKIVFLVVDGRAPGYSEGISIPQLAELMEDLGCVEALNLDGGGSSTYALRRLGDSELTILNRPSDGPERAVANSFLLFSEGVGQKLAHLNISPTRLRILAGSSLEMQAGALDEYYNPLDLTVPVKWSTTGNVGTISEAGLFTAGEEGSGEIIAHAVGAEGRVKVEVVPAIDEIQLTQEVMAVESGAEIPVEFTAFYKGQAIQVAPGDFTWETTGEIGVVEEGVLKTTAEKASGKLRISRGEVSVEMQVDVGREPILLEDFAQGIDHWLVTGTRFRGLRARISTAPEEPVRLGKHALRIDYDFRDLPGVSGVYAQPITPYTLEGYPDRIGLWIYGDGEGQWLRGQMLDGDNNAFNIDYTEGYPNGVTWTGWKYVEAPIPEGKKTPLKLQIPIRYMADKEYKGTGTIYIDYIQAIYGENKQDVTVPEISDLKPEPESVVSSATPIISAVVIDEETGIDASSIRLKVDNKLVEADFNEKLGRVSYSPSASLGSGPHHVFLEVRDQAGNPKEKKWSFTVESGGPEPSLTAPDRVFDQTTIQVDLAVNNPQSLQGAEFIWQTAGDFELKEVLTENSNFTLDVESGQLRLAFADLNITDTLEKAALAELKLQIPAGSELVEFQLIEGSLQLVTGETLPFRLEPLVLEVEPRFALKVEGTEVGSPTLLQFVDNYLQQPVSGGEITVVNPQHKLAFVTQEAEIYGRPNLTAPVLFQGTANDKFLAGREVREFQELLLPDGSRGWALTEDVQVVSWGVPLGCTDESGMLKTDDLTLAPLTVEVIGKSIAGASQPVKLEIIAPLLGIEPENIILTMPADPLTSQTFSWWTHPKVNNSVVKYKPANSNIKWLTTAGTSQVLVTSLGELRTHHVTAADLMADTLYQYKVGDPETDTWSQVSTFKTSSENKFSFLFMADTQTGGAFTLWQNLLTEALTQYPEARFIIHGGDIVDNGFSFDEWSNFVSYSKDFFNERPLVATLGNHDVYGEGKEIFASLFPFPLNGPEGEIGHVYSFDYGPAHFAVLNSEGDAASLRAQAEWLRKDVSQSGQVWNIVLFHRAPYKSNPLRDEDQTLTILAPVLEELGIDLVLNGHDHSYLRTYPLKGGKPAAAGERGTVYVIGGSAGPKFYPAEDSRGVAATLFGENIQIYSVITVDKNKISLTVKTIEGEIVEEFELTK